MSKTPISDSWERGNPYEQYMGRWSRRIAPLFLSWLNQPAGRRWLDVGCGTGALSAAILEFGVPNTLVGIEPSDGLRELAVQSLGARGRFLAGSAVALPVESGACDVVVSGLVLNFLPNLPAALSEMIRVTASSGTIAGYVWDYADGMEITRYFWDAAVSIDPAAAPLHEGARFPVCNPAALSAAFRDAGLAEVDTTALELKVEFADFEAYWHPFLGGQGPAPAYAMSLSEEHRSTLRARVHSTLPSAMDGTIALRARAWAVRGAVVRLEP